MDVHRCVLGWVSALFPALGYTGKAGEGRGRTTRVLHFYTSKVDQATGGGFSLGSKQRKI